MERTTWGWPAVAVVTAMTATAGSVRVTAQHSEPVDTAAHPAATTEATSAGDFSADVLIEEGVIDERGATVESRPQTRYHLTSRVVAGGGIETEIVYPPARLFPRGPLVDPRGGYRLVFDSALTNPRIYDPTGRLVGPPPGVQPLTGPPVAPSARPRFVHLDKDLRSRQRELVRQFGPAVGTLAGRDRYVAQVDDLLTETLVEPSSMLPVEVNLMRNGELQQRTSIGYGRMPGGRWYVALTRSEAALPGRPGRRFVSKVSHLNVVSQEGR